jgi:hypothetical protein
MKHETHDNLERMFGRLREALDAQPEIAPHVSNRLSDLPTPVRTQHRWSVAAGLVAAAVVVAVALLWLPGKRTVPIVDQAPPQIVARLELINVCLEQRFSFAVKERAVLVASIMPADREVSWVWPGDNSTWRDHLLWRSGPRAGRQCLVYLLVGDKAANPYITPPQAGIRFDDNSVSAMGVTPLPSPPQVIRQALRQLQNDWPAPDRPRLTYAHVQQLLADTEKDNGL